MKVFSAADVRRLLPMADCIEAMDRCQRAASAGELVLPHRVFASLPDGSGLFGVKPGISPSIGIYGAKLISLHPGNPQQGRPMLQGVVVLFDAATGVPIALIEAGALTAIRTAAASAMATRTLARHDANSLGLFGTGEQAGTHLQAICTVRPITEVIVWGRLEAKVDAFVQAHQRSGLSLRAGSAAETGACDIVCTVTGSAVPVLEAEWLKPGAHINLVGAFSATTREASSAVIARASVFVELMVAALQEAGDLLIPLQEGVITTNHLRAEIGAVAAGLAAGRQHDDEITLYKSLGNAAQDLFAAEYVLRRGLEQGLGRQVSLSGN